MKPTFIHSLLYLTAGIQFAGAFTYKCNADNCARGITGTAIKVPITQRRVDCSKFMGASGPDVATVTTTVMKTATVSKTVGTRTETVTGDSEAEETAPAGKKPTEDDTAKDTTDDAEEVDDTPAADEKEEKMLRRAAYGDDTEKEEEKPAPATTPKPAPATTSAANIPSYASYCSGAVRYSSACSCWGITKGDSTPTTETETVTKTTTATISVTAVVKKTEVVCSKAQEKCGGTCKSVMTDKNNCGACGVACGSAAVCINGVCSEPDCDKAEEWNCDNESKSGCNGQSDHDCFCLKGIKETGSFCTSFANLPLCSNAKKCDTHDACGKGEVCGFLSCCGKSICVRPHDPESTCGNKASTDRLFKSRKQKREEKLRLRKLAKAA